MRLPLEYPRPDLIQPERVSSMTKARRRDWKNLVDVMGLHQGRHDGYAMSVSKDPALSFTVYLTKRLPLAQSRSM